MNGFCCGCCGCCGMAIVTGGGGLANVWRGGRASSLALLLVLTVAIFSAAYLLVLFSFFRFSISPFIAPFCSYSGCHSFLLPLASFPARSLFSFFPPFFLCLFVSTVCFVQSLLADGELRTKSGPGSGRRGRVRIYSIECSNGRKVK